MRAILLLIVLAAAGCANGTSDVTLILSDVPTGVTQFSVTVTLNPHLASEKSKTVTLPEDQHGPSQTLNLSFAASVRGSLLVDVIANGTNGALASGQGSGHVTPSQRSSIAVSFDGTQPGDMGDSDLAGVDLGAPDLVGQHICIFDTNTAADEFDNGCVLAP